MRPSDVCGWGGLVALLVGLALPGVADGHAAGPAPESSVATSAPAAYVIKQASFPAPSSTLDSPGSVACPTGTATWGGGVAFDVFSTHASINTTEWNGATPGAWNVRVNNPDPGNAAFSVFAVCAKKPTGYQEVSTRVDNPPGLATGTATCPSTKVLLSGGVGSTSDSALASLVQARPVSSRGFRATQLNNTGSDQPFYVYALCAVKPAGYSQTKVSISVAPQTAGATAAKCPATATVIGGGFNMSSLGGLTVNGSFPTANSMSASWSVFAFDNASATTYTLSAYAICAS